ncbi:hypothetical protein LQG66_17830 [Bradyrhizobium ontarionense]|uniref:Uncharacterized protein n=1 Tax=Bradyrhizobium ontarionense TaxID=2898149 RepID=A0ABY3RNG3_9BRAD|nr:hypothetical protein [Bradyrhizobium sp. A19]UFZ08039.1 hypothetical protein LQG66_17830 [Bradyrhizobium sp. A19]
MAKTATILGRKWQLITHFILTPKGAPCGTDLLNLEEIHSRFNGESSVYGSVAGGPEVLWIFPFDSAAALDSFKHPLQTGETAKLDLHELVGSVTTSLHTFKPGASKVHAKEPAAAPAFLYNINLKLSTYGVLSTDLDLLGKLGGLHKHEVYVYASTIGGGKGPVVTLQFPLKSLGDLQKIDDPLGTVLANAGPELAKTFTASIASISTVLYRKLV